jgi:glucosamine 6-phosphate synthetase-like amidotransferase/phosphosugar isomerase protein
MCGIGAFQIVGNECEPAKVARVLLRLLEVRGKDASGVAWHDGKGGTFVRKNNCAGKELAKVLKDNVGNTGVVHTRWATLGSPKVEANNHPIDVGGVVGVHNGHCTNHIDLISKCEGYARNGQVDSEAIFALIAHGPKKQLLRTRLAQVQGNAALLWLRSFDKNNRLHAARLTSSPLWFGQTKLGSVIFASTEAILLETAKRCGLVFEYTHEMAEGSYVRVEDGVLSEMQTINLPKPKFVLPKHDYTKTSTYYKPAKNNKEFDLAEPLLLEFDDDEFVDEFDYELEQWEHDLYGTNLRQSLDKQFGMGAYKRDRF